MIATRTFLHCAATLLLCGLTPMNLHPQSTSSSVSLPHVAIDSSPALGFPLFARGRVSPVCIAHEDAEVLQTVVPVFREDLRKVAGATAAPAKIQCHDARVQIIVGSIDESPLLARMIDGGKLDVSSLKGHWEEAIVRIVQKPLPGIDLALVVAGSDPRGAAFALFEISRSIGVSPWTWWADVPVKRHKSAYVTQDYTQGTPAVLYRGIFLNDEDWGLRPWAARKMDPVLKNIGPNTYAHICELLLRLHANTLWPAMHPGSMPFHMVPENARLAARWGIVISSSHSEAMLRNNVGEWDEGRDGPWAYQANRVGIDRYWDASVAENGRYENIYTVGMRGQHDSGLEANGTASQRAKLVEQVIADQRSILSRNLKKPLNTVPQVIWLYKESIDLYRAGLQIPPDVTLGWTDDNYGYLRQLPNKTEQERPGGSALYYHVSYWGAPHDYLWLNTTPTSLMREELTKAWDHGVRKMWILNVGDLKPAEEVIDYFLRLAWQLPASRELTEEQISVGWFSENFPSTQAPTMAALQRSYFHLNFIRKPEFMGFNGYTDEVRRTAFNPLAWGDQNRKRLTAWTQVASKAKTIAASLPNEYQDAAYELFLYPITVSAAQNAKFLWTDRSFLDHHSGDYLAMARDVDAARSAYRDIQNLTARFNARKGGKWEGMMSAAPRSRRVFEMPETAKVLGTAPEQLPGEWQPPLPASRTSAGLGVREIDRTVSINPLHYEAKTESAELMWQAWPDLGVAEGSIGIARPGTAKSAEWTERSDSATATYFSRTPSLRYEFQTETQAPATLSIALLPTFPLDSDHRLRYAISVDDSAPIMLDASGSEDHRPGLSDWSVNVLRNVAFQRVDLGQLPKGEHHLVLFYGEPGVLFQNITVTFPGAPPAYPFPPETRKN